MSILSQPFVPSLNKVTLCQFPSLILFSLVMTATPVPQLNLGVQDREGKVTVLNYPNTCKMLLDSKYPLCSWEPLCFTLHIKQHVYIRSGLNVKVHYLSLSKGEDWEFSSHSQVNCKACQQLELFQDEGYCNLSSYYNSHFSWE